MQANCKTLESLSSKCDIGTKSYIIVLRKTINIRISYLIPDDKLTFIEPSQLIDTLLINETLKTARFTLLGHSRTESKLNMV